MMEDYLKYDVDLEQFWKDDEIAHRDNCFYEGAPQVAFGLGLTEVNVFSELNVPGDPEGYNPPELVYDYCRRYNDKAEKIIGKRILSEEHPRNHEKFPAIKLHGEVFGGQYIYKNGMFWLTSDIDTPEKLEAMLERVEKMNLREFILPPNWESEKKRIFEETGERPNPWFYGHRVRGPVTLAMSIYGVENTIFLMYDEPELAHRFFQDIENVLIGYTDICNAEAGEELLHSKHWGYRFNDDNCCMLTPDLYEEFAYPIMAHLLPILSRLDFMGVNFGPTVLFDEIRKYMPHTRIDGCLNPMTLLKNDEEGVIAQVKRDCEMAIQSGTRGLCIDAAGSVNDGTMLTTVRAVMYAIQKYGRY